MRIPVQYLAPITVLVVALSSGCDGNATEIASPETMAAEPPESRFTCSLGAEGWECQYHPDLSGGGEPDDGYSDVDDLPVIVFDFGDMAGDTITF